MDLASAIKDDALRPLATIVAPGAIAIGPYVLVIGYYVPVVSRFWSEHETAFGFIVGLGILTAGFAVEEIAALIEVLWHRVLSNRYAAHVLLWRIYLRLREKDDIVGLRHHSDVTTRLKFELSMAPSLVICAAGLNWLNHLYGMWSRPGIVGITLVALAFAGFFLWQSFETADLLSRLRGAIVDAARLDTAADLFRPSASSAWSRPRSNER